MIKILVSPPKDYCSISWNVKFTPKSIDTGFNRRRNQSRLFHETRLRFYIMYHGRFQHVFFLI